MLLKLIIIMIIGFLGFQGILSCGKPGNEPLKIEHRKISVDGVMNDWESVNSYFVGSENYLWIGQGLTLDQWKGERDLSFSFKTAWNDNYIYFLIHVVDNRLSSFSQPFSWLNDCIEIYLDPNNRSGERIKGIGAENTHQDKIGRKMYGYEMHFLPSDPPKVFVDDSRGIYYTDSAQTSYFKKSWKGEHVLIRTDQGYMFEIGFKVPDTRFRPGKIIGLDIAVCDDDGNGRKSLLLWSGDKGNFWITMDAFKKMELTY